MVNDVILHDDSGRGTRLMPTELTYSAFWGPGDVSHKGDLVAGGRAIHMMLTEFVREEPYDLVFDENVNPDLRHLHLMVLPFTSPPRVSRARSRPASRCRTGWSSPSSTSCSQA